MSSLIAHENEPKFSQPIRQILLMIIVLVVVGFVVYALTTTVWPIFGAAPYLNGFILAVFFAGVFACFYQVLTLISSVSWIEGFALDRPGHEFVRTPRLLAPLAALLRDTRARRALTTTSTRSILDSVAQRLEEGRDITRYIINLLIFLGLLGTFFGLAKTVPEVVNTIRNMAPPEGSDQTINFAGLMDGLEGQLGGMGTAFSSSLIGLAGSLVVGMLELFAGHGQNRFYTELEEWLSSITRISIGTPDDGPRTAAAALSGDTSNAEQIGYLSELVRKSEERRIETDSRITALTDAVTNLTRQLADNSTRSGGSSNGDGRALDRLADTQDRIAQLLSAREEDTGQMDAETRMRMRNIDVQLLRILEEMSEGRQDSIAAIRSELSSLASTIRGTSGG